MTEPSAVEYRAALELAYKEIEKHNDSAGYVTPKATLARIARLARYYVEPTHELIYWRCNSCACFVHKRVPLGQLPADTDARRKAIAHGGDCANPKCQGKGTMRWLSPAELEAVAGKGAL